VKRKDIVTLVAATIVILFSIIVMVGHSGGSKKSSSVTKVQSVVPTFDTSTVKKLDNFFPVQFNLKDLGRPDPFAGI
jgi:hypothetical protein